MFEVRYFLLLMILVCICVFFQSFSPSNSGQFTLKWALSSCVKLIFVIFAYSIYYYYYLEHFDSDSQIINSLYFSVISFSTIGYGDIFPKNEVRFLSVSEGIVGQITVAMVIFKMVEYQSISKRLSKSKVLPKTIKLTLFFFLSAIVSLFNNNFSENIWLAFITVFISLSSCIYSALTLFSFGNLKHYKYRKKTIEEWLHNHHIKIHLYVFCIFICTVVLLLFGFANIYSSLGVVNSFGDTSKSIIDAIYFSFTTFTTIAYGDFHATGLVKLIVVFQALICFILISTLCSLVLVFLNSTKYYHKSYEH